MVQIDIMAWQKMAFGRNLARIRRERGWTQEDLVRESRVPISTIRRYEGETSSPKLEHLANLARALGVSADDLIFDPQDGVARKRIHDPGLLRQFEEVQQLDEPEREAVRLIIDGLLVRRKVAGLVPMRETTGRGERQPEADAERGRQIRTLVEDLVQAAQKPDRRRGPHVPSADQKR